jgi:hypothetical protein
MDIPYGYLISRDLDSPWRWVVSYKGDPFLFIKKTRFSERIRTFRTKKAASDYLQAHLAEIARLRAL